MSTESKGGSNFSTMGLLDVLRQARDCLYDLPLTSKSALETLIGDYADDVESVCGFDDDAELVNEFQEFLARPDLNFAAFSPINSAFACPAS